MTMNETVEISKEPKPEAPAGAPSVYSYLDYRRFLRDFYEYEKARKRFFSYRYFANKAGFRARTFLYKVMQGEKALSKESILSVGKAMGLAETEMEYFSSLVHFNEAKTQKGREHYYSAMNAFREPRHGTALSAGQFEYLSHWYHAVIRELIVMDDFNGDIKALADSLVPKITAEQAAESVQLLLGLNLIRKRSSRRFVQTDSILKTADSDASDAVHRYQKETMALASHSLDSIEKDLRTISTLTIGISGSGFAKLRDEIARFRNNVVTIVHKDSPADRVYQMNFQFFPLSKPYSAEEK